MNLIVVVGLAVGKHDLQGDVEIDLVHGARQVGDQRSHREKDDPGMVRKKVPAVGHQPFDGRRAAVLEREIDHVS